MEDKIIKEIAIKLAELTYEREGVYVLRSDEIYELIKTKLESQG